MPTVVASGKIDRTMSFSSPSFHESLKSAVPPEELGKFSTNYWVAVIHDNKETAASVDEPYDILWVKCNGRTTIEKIKAQFLARYPHSEEIRFRCHGLIRPGTRNVAALNYFNDNLIALEAVKESNLNSASRPETRQRQPLQPVSNPGPRNSIVKKEPSIKQEPLNRPGEYKSRLRSNSQLSWLYRYSSNSFSAIPPHPSPPNQNATSPKYGTAKVAEFNRIECGFRDFMHERLANFYNENPQLSDTHEHLAHFASEWVTIPQHVKDLYAQRAITFIAHNRPTDNNMFLFSWENAGFYRFLFRLKSVYDTLTRELGPDKAFVEMLQRWSDLPERVRDDDKRKALQFRLPLADSYESFLNGIIGLMQTRDSQVSNPPVMSSKCIPKALSLPGPSSAPETSTVSGTPSILEPQGPPPLCLQKIFENSTPELLEAAAQKGVQLLEELKKPLIRAQSEDASQWLQSIENVQKQATPAKTIVGVVGNTGAGKSSVINAMLDEERLVPTNCMRACTAVVTEISYNNTEDPYQAEIEFITKEDWEKELKILFQDLFDGSGNISREATNEDTEAGVAYAKIKAVYPKYTREMLQESSVEELMGHANVRDVLGGRREFVESDSLHFYKRLQFYVDSKEKTSSEKKKEKNPPREMEFWPLIKVVRLYVKAAALSTGAVIVDLPGVHDSNAARSAVAEGYMKQCTGLWIVAPINRAVDDKAAKSLLGETFKRQLKMDGAFNTVTFICSKTDDISIMECQESLGLEEEMSSLWAKSDEHADRKRQFKKKLDELKETKALYTATADDVDEQLEVWEALKEDLEDDKTVYAPRDSSSKKRKRGSAESSRAKKKARPTDSDGDSDSIEDDEEETACSDSDEEEEAETRGEPLTSEQIDEKLSELKSLKKESRHHKQEVDKEIKELRKQISEIDAAEAKINAEMSAIAISGRNEYSRTAIQQDFAAGIKELDQELAEEQDAANFNPDVDARDYEMVARSLPVFCVSSRAYQKLQGRLKKEATVPGFQNIQETEVPQLQAHCKKLTEATRLATCRRFLNSLSQLLNSLRLWSCPDGDGGRLSQHQKEREAQILQNKFQRLDSELKRHIENVCQELRSNFEDNIFDVFSDAVSAATNEANTTAYRWGLPVSRDNRSAGGYFWSTYKAICRRNGVYSNAQGPHDWNAELTAPVIKAISSGWERTFSRRVPIILNSFHSKVAGCMKSFHDEVEAGARRSGGGALASLQMLAHQLYNYRELLKDLCNTKSSAVMSEAKEINRMFQPVIADAVEPAYRICTEERGSGSFVRMKNHMTSHIDIGRWTMFNASTDKVKRALEALIKSVERDMPAKIKEIISFVRRDYSSALIGNNSAKGLPLSEDQRSARHDVLGIISGCENSFKKLAGLSSEIDEEESASSEIKQGFEQTEIIDFSGTPGEREPVKPEIRQSLGQAENLNTLEIWNEQGRTEPFAEDEYGQNNSRSITPFTPCSNLPDLPSPSQLFGGLKAEPED